LPKLPELYRAIYIREGGARVAYEQLADEIANELRRDPARDHVNMSRKESSAA
jgi:hypothetical protein